MQWHACTPYSTYLHILDSKKSKEIVDDTEAALDKSSHQHLCLKKRHRKNSKRQSSRQIYLQGDIIQQYQAMKLHTIPQSQLDV